jgi:predicted GTPase
MWKKKIKKSSLVNLLLGEEVSYVNSVNSTTNCIREYSHKKYNLNIFDTVGFDKGNNKDKDEIVDEVIKDIKKF